MQILQATAQQLAVAAKLAQLLWPEHTTQELEDEFRELIASPQNALFLAYVQERAVAFAQCGLRHDYVEGTAHSPVGYLEGIYVREEFRKKGIACALLQKCMDWSREQGCHEFASDCELQNTQSLQFHLQSGFAEANRIICFVQKL